MFSRYSLLPVLIPVATLFLAGGVAHAAPSNAQWQAINVQLTRDHILPRYQTLARNSTELAAATDMLCQQPEQLAAAQTAFHNTMDAWQGIQHVQFGPVEFLMRNFSMQFWPDKKNLTSKQLNELLSQEAAANLTPEYFRGASIAVKGLPALERLLFSDKYQTPYGCQLTAAIASNVATMSREIAEEWESQQLPRIDAAPDGEDYYEDSTEAATELMKALVEPVEVVRDLKLLRPLHKGANKAKPRRAESWRSERSLRNIQLNLAALAELYRGNGSTSVKELLTAEGEAALAYQIDTHFQQLDNQLSSIDKTLYLAVKDPADHATLKQVSDQMKILHRQLEEAMQKLNIQLGFNSRDGD
ncbi:imelysin family protein [Pontibacterium sp.]|uniref:imelysin family protein n=1 Tax=Pontibacterium sp. TaxID=2036026 RepID=UPI003511DE3A